MKFREWFQLDEIRYSGLWKQWKEKNPGVPDYVLRQMYMNHVAPEMTQSLQNAGTPQMPATQFFSKQPDAGATVAYTPPTNSPLGPNLPSQVINQSNMLDGIVWPKKPQIVTISPMSFDSHTLNTFLRWGFGYNNFSRVRDDAGRTDKQRQLAGERQEGDNEPVIMVDLGNGQYRLMEGFHRTASYLLQGASPQDIEMLKQGQTQGLNLGKWRPISIKAYVGMLGNQNTQNTQAVNPYVPNQATVGGNALTA